MDMDIINIVHTKLKEKYKELNYRLIAVAYTGSQAYGTNTKDSDIDILGIYLPPAEYILGIHEEPKTITFDKDFYGFDGQLHSFTKWYKLLVAQNPNVLEILWNEENQYIYRDEVFWKLLIDNKTKFLSKKLKHSFGGYAFSQLNKLDQLNKKANQNKQRLEEIEKFGYSTKNASHLFRLLNMCLDALVDGSIKVLRPERQFLLNIRNGNYSYDEIVKMANKKFELVEEAYIKSNLAVDVNFEFANNFHINFIKTYLKT